MEPIPEVRAGPWSKKALWIILGASLVLRVAWMFSVNTMPVTDYWWYYERAVGIASGQGYSVDGAPTAYWPVGFSSFLATFFFFLKPSITLAKILNLLLVMGSLALTFRIAHRLFLSNAVAVVSTVALSLHFNWIAYSGILASEPLYTFLTLYGTWCLMTTEDVWGKTVIGGFAFGLAALVRPQAALLPLLVLLFAPDRIRHRSMSSAVIVACSMVGLVIVPWAARNWKVMGGVAPVSTNMGDNLLIGNNPRATGSYMNPLEIDGSFASDEIARNSYSTRAGLEFAFENPSETVQRWPAKVWGTFGRASDGPYWSFMKVAGQMTVPGGGGDKALFLFSRRYADLYHGLLVGLFVVAVGALAVFRKRFSHMFRVPRLGFVLLAYTAVLSMVFFGNPRFAFPVLPYLCMYVAAFLVLVWTSLVRSGAASRNSILDV